MAPTFLCPDVEISSSCCFFLLAAFLAAFWSLKQQVSSILIDIYPPPGSGPVLHHHHHTAASSSAYQGLKINKQHIVYGIFIIYQYVWGTVKHTLALLLYWNELNICFAVTFYVRCCGMYSQRANTVNVKCWAHDSRFWASFADSVADPDPH